MRSLKTYFYCLWGAVAIFDGGNGDCPPQTLYLIKCYGLRYFRTNLDLFLTPFNLNQLQLKKQKTGQCLSNLHSDLPYLFSSSVCTLCTKILELPTFDCPLNVVSRLTFKLAFQKCPPKNSCVMHSLVFLFFFVNAPLHLYSDIFSYEVHVCLIGDWEF